MEDPKRLRTKLRLDLNEVQKQIEDIEDQMGSDKSSDTIERHKKLVEYEKKLKDQYEKIAGITIDQASSLDEKAIKSLISQSESFISRLLGLIAGLLLFNGFYNLTIHSYEGLDPMDYLDYLSGEGQSVSPFLNFAGQLKFDSTTNFIAIPLIAGITLLLLSILFSKSGSKFYKLFQLLGISIPISYFFYLIIYQSNAIDVTTAFDDNMGYLGVAVIVGGMLYLFGLFDDRSRFNKLLILITAFALIDSGIQILLAAIDGNPLETLLFTWG
ncbi:MAG: hypothetical protein HeimC2_33120 [Candidatus Heimdallarchaeota archaeon LC_2]|nr:MAG: hypothetical protein HeimC2_33120 [Candidatus Heimdallarchaeota archaeon LC_2]